MSDKEQMTTEYKPKKKAEFLKFIYNKDTKEFCGRNAESWVKIVLFYIIFYACLAAFFAIMLVVFLETLDTRRPTYTLDKSKIGTNPGMGVFPKPKDVGSTLIRFKHGENGDWHKLVEKIDTFFNDLKENARKGSGNSRQCRKDTKPDPNKVCHRDLTTENIDLKLCTPKQNYGYPAGTPCVVIKLNKIFDWMPMTYNKTDLPKDMPDDTKNNFQDDHIAVSCEGENAADKEFIGNVEIFPKEGLPKIFFPFTNLDGYESPYVFVHFKNPKPGVLINVHCKAWAKNIKVNPTERVGSVHFELLIE